MLWLFAAFVCGLVVDMARTPAASRDFWRSALFGAKCAGLLLAVVLSALLGPAGLGLFVLGAVLWAFVRLGRGGLR